MSLFRLLLILLLALGSFALIPACSGDPDDDDDSADDDDDATDDDDTVDDDDASDDDDSAGDDDDMSDDDDSSIPPVEDCDDRTDGAMIVFQIGPKGQTEEIQLWLTDEDFIDGAITRIEDGFHWAGFVVVWGLDCDEQWEFHAAPALPFWFGSPPFSDHCDVLPSEIAGDPNGWNTTDDSWCPSNLTVLSVDDRRSSGDDDDSASGDDDDSASGS